MTLRDDYALKIYEKHQKDPKNRRPDGEIECWCPWCQRARTLLREKGESSE